MRKLCIFLGLLFFALGARAETAQAYFAGGCFWCMESNYQDKEGVLDVISGFTGGTLENPSYKGNHEGHFEAIKVSYDPQKISYQQLLDLFWVSIDPFDNEGQFCDKGFSYRSAIFTSDPVEKRLAAESLQAVQARFPGQEVYTELRDAGAFWPVEEYHQDYYLKNPVRYNYYRWNCGRDKRTKEIWGDAAAH